LKRGGLSPTSKWGRLQNSFPCVSAAPTEALTGNATNSKIDATAQSQIKAAVRRFDLPHIRIVPWLLSDICLISKCAKRPASDV